MLLYCRWGHVSGVLACVAGITARCDTMQYATILIHGADLLEVEGAAD